MRAAEIVAALSLATDIGIGVPLEHGLHSTVFAMRLGERLGVDSETASQTYYGCLLFYIGCTANAEMAAEVFGDYSALTRYGGPFRFGSRIEMMSGMLRALAPPGSTPVVRAYQLAHRLPRLARELRGNLVALCETAQLLTDRLGLAAPVSSLFSYVDERWDGKGAPGHAKGDAIPLPVRIIQVARDAAFQRMLGGQEFAAHVIRERAGGAFDPEIAAQMADEAAEILALDTDASVWQETLACEPVPPLMLKAQAIEEALAAMGDFADLVSRYLVGHSAGVAELATMAAQLSGLEGDELVAIRRAALIHDMGRIAVPVRVWQKTGPLTPDDWEQVRLHAYQTERILARSAFFAPLLWNATAHHERLDGSGYHRGTSAAALTRSARLLAAADAYHAMTEPRPHREALTSARIAEILSDEVRAGRQDAEAVSAVLKASGERVPRLKRPAGLSEREAEVIGLLARGFQTKQIARALAISVKTADSHVQNAYRKIGVSTRAAATLFAMQHGLIAWGELPISRTAERS